ncbi:MAG: hypothetical protein JSV68_10680 [Anaerolineaceae bacterium]|nr:MAG: hypothetical protein JSV68_10680 [Anaerolineaceae bacterium]
MDAERKRASDWYRWLWLSPLITIPTLVSVLFAEIVWSIVCRGLGSCDWRLAEQISLMLAILLSAAWHLVLLKPISDKESPFVRWHGLQAICLAGLRTAIPLLSVIVFGFDYPLLFAIIFLFVIWLLGTGLAQQEAGQGKCSLARIAGQGDELARYRQLETEQKPRLVKTGSGDAEEWVHIIRYSQDPAERHQALKELRLLNMVEDF